MARIPLTVAQRSLEIGSVVQCPTADSIGKALVGAGQQISEVAAHWQKSVEKDEDLKATLGFDNFRRTTEAKMLEAKDAMPADGAGFLDSVRNTATEEKKGFLSTLPPRLRERYDSVTNNALITLESKAAGFQLDASRGFARTEIAKLHNRLTDDILANPDLGAADQVYGLGLKAIEDSRLPELEKVQRRQLWHDNARTVEAQARWRDQPEELAKAFGVPYQRILDRTDWEKALVQKESRGNWPINVRISLATSHLLSKRSRRSF